MSLAQRLLVGLISVYRAAISPLLGSNCRFHPTCSAYAAQAIEELGVPRGSWLAARRLLRCHPYNPGGYDPVRAAIDQAAAAPPRT